MLAVALATVAYQYAFGPAAVVAEIRNGLPFNLFLTLVGFMVLFLVSRRTERIQAILRDAAGQEETFRRLHEAMGALGGAAGLAAGEVEQGLAPAVGELDGAGRRLQQVQQAAVLTAGQLAAAVEQVVGAMTDQARQVTEAPRVPADMAGSMQAAAADAAGVAEAAVESSRQAADGSRGAGGGGDRAGVAGLRRHADERPG